MHTKQFRSFIALTAVSTLLLATGCGGNQTKPDDLTVDQHRDHAKQEAAAATSHSAKYNAEARGADPVAVSGAVTGGVVEWPVTNYNPTAHHNVTAERLKKSSAAHLAAAASLEKYEAGECKKFPSATRCECPLHGPIEHWQPTANGVRLTIRAGVPVAAVAAHARCHFAFGRAHGRDDMPDCPLYIADLKITVNADGRTLDLTSAKAAKELQRRASTHALRKGEAPAEAKLHKHNHHHGK